MGKHGGGAPREDANEISAFQPSAHMAAAEAGAVEASERGGERGGFFVRQASSGRPAWRSSRSLEDGTCPPPRHVRIKSVVEEEVSALEALPWMAVRGGCVGGFRRM